MQVFSRGTVLALKLIAIATIVVVAMGIAAWRSLTALAPAWGEPVEQPIPFSHKHHVGDDGIDCRYCHSSVETAAFAGIPPLSTCMTCHSQLYADAPLLSTLRVSFQSGQGLSWRRVNVLPDFVYFDHSIHIAKGVGCSTCHGRVDTMPLMERQAPLDMQWCLDCHRNPRPYLRTQSKIFDMHWQPGDDGGGQRLAEYYHLRTTAELTACSTCHR